MINYVTLVRPSIWFTEDGTMLASLAISMTLGVVISMFRLVSLKIAIYFASTYFFSKSWSNRMPSFDKTKLVDMVYLEVLESGPELDFIFKEVIFIVWHWKGAKNMSVFYNKF